ncbi:hypothetical protein GCM10007874_38900 [Labrys miyagiensis]|uniref:Uncharacterized protein n=1 Tax=Labrys miyagiensis TaxID=346912 RepID=A0ABQ6CM80_9HYPH|nr:hypothetical protein [Labrys miyagiensis]GLS20873.1 hypothetical protein GCM10007874_38900 [Labrys miyagiensis]
MLNVSYANKQKSLSKSLVLATMVALLCITFAGAAFADAGDRDLDVNAINPAPNLLAPSPMPAPASAQRMKPVHTARVASRHHGYAQAKDIDRRY